MATGSNRREPAMPSVFDATCSARHALELIASKWTMLILPALADGPMRNGALLRWIEGISQKMLTQTLRDLERNGLVMREDCQTVPPHVEYRLSPLGRSLSETLIMLDRWAERNFPALDAAREEFDARQNRRR
jgi:DNA-binding HxlR family transcriptional regulator